MTLVYTEDDRGRWQLCEFGHGFFAYRGAIDADALRALIEEHAGFYPHGKAEEVFFYYVPPHGEHEDGCYYETKAPGRGRFLVTTIWE